MRHKNQPSAAQPINLLMNCAPRLRRVACALFDNAVLAQARRGLAGFQVRGWSRYQYLTKLNTVDEVVGGVTKRLALKN
jgi:hypothetical protein